MVTRTEITQFDDIDGSTGDVRTLAIAVDGQQVEVDLSSANVDKLMAALEPYLSAGRKVGGGASRAVAVAPLGRPHLPRASIRKQSESGRGPMPSRSMPGGGS